MKIRFSMYDMVIALVCGWAIGCAFPYYGIWPFT